MVRPAVDLISRKKFPGSKRLEQSQKVNLAAASEHSQGIHVFNSTGDKHWLGVMLTVNTVRFCTPPCECSNQPFIYRDVAKW